MWKIIIIVIVPAKRDSFRHSRAVERASPWRIESHGQINCGRHSETNIITFKRNATAVAEEEQAEDVLVTQGRLIQFIGQTFALGHELLHLHSLVVNHPLKTGHSVGWWM